MGVTLEEFEERGLRASGALGASELELLADGLDILQVHHELLDPLRGALAYVLVSSQIEYIKDRTRVVPTVMSWACRGCQKLQENNERGKILTGW